MKFAIFIALVLVSVGVKAQGIESVRRSLAPDVVVIEMPEVQRVMRMVDTLPRPEKISVFAVRLFSDNSQSARSNAQSTAGRFAGMFPDIDARVSYESPYFRVTAGRFIDRTDAVALCGKVLAAFPKAFVVEEEMKLSNY